MIIDSEIVFITTTIYTECLELQQSQIKKLFPTSNTILIDGSDKLKWPNTIFNWINKLKEVKEKYFVLIDEDCFIINRNEIIKTLELVENGKYDIIGCPDGYHPFRTCNPIVINPFLLFGRVSDFNTKVTIDFSSVKYKLKNLGSAIIGKHYEWSNNAGLKFKHEYRENFLYNHPILSTALFQDGKEPYYCLFWYLKDIGFNFGYLFPYMDRKLITTNPKIDENSEEMAIHIWESRNMNSPSKLFGKNTKERFESTKEYILKLN